MAKRSLLSSTSHSAQDMCTLLNSFASAASDMLLFLNHVSRIDLFVMGGAETKGRVRLLHTTRVTKVRSPVLPPLQHVVEGEHRSPRHALAKFVKLRSRRDETFDVDGSEANSSPFRSSFELQIASQTFGTAAEVFQHASSTSARWLIHNGADTSPAALLKAKRADQLPWGGVAVCLTPSPDRVEGRAYCFLPLPIQTGLPVHINGAFAVSSNRRQLWKSGGDEAGTGSWKGEWNTFLIKSLLPALYSESVALCAQLWRCGLGPPDAPRSWLFDATWPRPRTRGWW